MSRSEIKLPDPIEKRNVLAQKDVPMETLLAYAHAYLEAESLDDAYNFFEKAGDARGVRQVKERAIEMGNTAMLFNMLRSRNVQVTREDWLAVAENALKQGKLAYAAQAYRRLGDQEKLQEILARIPGQKPGPPQEPEGK
jgi:hypothetical protein